MIHRYPICVVFALICGTLSTTSDPGPTSRHFSTHVEQHWRQVASFLVSGGRSAPSTSLAVQKMCPTTRVATVVPQVMPQVVPCHAMLLYPSFEKCWLINVDSQTTGTHFHEHIFPPAKIRMPRCHAHLVLLGKGTPTTEVKNP